MKRIPMIASLAVVLVLSGCGLFSKKPVPAADGGTTAPADGSVVEYDGGPATSAAPGAQPYPGPVEIGGVPAVPGAPVAGAESGRTGQSLDTVIYFEYDSSSLNEAGLRLADEFGKFLSDNPAARLRLEGHTDERGTREYNIGLGERRANAVQDALLARGASASQLSVISYGEERPVNADQTEQGYSANRRVQIVKQ